MDVNGLEQPTAEKWEPETLRVRKKRQGSNKRLKDRIERGIWETDENFALNEKVKVTSK